MKAEIVSEIYRIITNKTWLGWKSDVYVDEISWLDYKFTRWGLTEDSAKSNAKKILDRHYNKKSNRSIERYIPKGARFEIDINNTTLPKGKILRGGYIK